MRPDVYFAGFFDGEGSIEIIPRLEGRENYRLRVSVSNTNYDVLAVFVERFGGRIAPHVKRGNRKPSWDWIAPGGEEFLRIVFPYLIVKRERAELALRFCDLLVGVHSLRGGRGDVWEQRRERTMDARRACCDEMRSLNRRGLASEENVA